MSKVPKFPFEVSFKEIKKDPERYVDSIFSCLGSEFFVMPKGVGFIEYPVFEKGYEVLKAATKGFSHMNVTDVFDVTIKEPISIIVLRTMLGFTPPEWGYITSEKTGVVVDQGFIRNLDRKVRMSPETSLKSNEVMNTRLMALVETACDLLTEGPSKVDKNQMHRLDKADTKQGIVSIKNLANMGAPYALLLYERFLGRPFAGHRDSVSEIVGDVLESAIEDVLNSKGISYRKTKRAERIEGFDQAPDFIIPSEFNPQVIIEAKVTEDDGTARDKVTRIQHLGELSGSKSRKGKPKYEVIACIGGRGFKVRRGDMKKMILATRGKVFTLKTLNKLVDCTRLKDFRTK